MRIEGNHVAPAVTKEAVYFGTTVIVRANITAIAADADGKVYAYAGIPRLRTDGLRLWEPIHSDSEFHYIVGVTAKFDNPDEWKDSLVILE